MNCRFFTVLKLFAAMHVCLVHTDKLPSALPTLLLSLNLSDFSITDPFTLLSNFGSYAPGGGTSSAR